MLKKSFLISILVISLVLVWVIDSSAVTCSRCRRSPWGLCIEEVLKGLGNVSKNTTYSIIGISVEKITVESWCNHGDECNGGPGNPFELHVTADFRLEDLITKDQLQRNGSAYIEGYIPGCFMWDAVFCAGDLVSPRCVQYACKTPDPNDPYTCLVWDYNICEYSGGVCTSSYDYSEIPPEAYPANGNTNWYPEPPRCDPNTQPLGRLDTNGNVAFERMYVLSLKEVSGESYGIDEACLVLNADRVSYSRVPLSECCSYTGTCP